MRGGWITSTLGDLCEFRRGLTYKKTDEVATSRNVVLRANNITVDTGEINFDELRFIREEIEIPESKKILPGSLLVCTASGSKKHLGKIGLVKDDSNYAFGGFMGLLVPSERALPKYLFWLTRSDFYKGFISDLSDGVNINNLKWSQLSQLQVPLPPLTEQEQIVAILDETFAAISTAIVNAEKNLANAQELFESELNRVFSQKEDGWVPVEHACLSIVDCVNKTAPQATGETPFRMIRTTNVRHGRISLDKVRYVSEDTYRKWIRRQKPEPGDVVLTREAPMGEVGILNDGDGVFLGQRLVAYRADLTRTTPEFLLYVLRSRPLQQQMRAFGSGSTVQHMRVPDTKRLLVPLPSLDGQGEIVGKLSGIERFVAQLTSIDERKLTLLTELKQSILHKAFTGDLTANPKVADRTLSGAGL